MFSPRAHYSLCGVVRHGTCVRGFSSHIPLPVVTSHSFSLRTRPAVVPLSTHCRIHGPTSSSYRTIYSSHHPLQSSYLNANPTAPSSTRTASPSQSASSAASQFSLPGASLYTNFSELGLQGGLLTRLNELGVKQPTIVQQRVMPVLKQWSRTPVLFQAPTGTGKSLSYLLPVLQRLLADETERRTTGQKRTQIQALILCPSQELAIQTQAQIQSLIAYDTVTASDPTFLALCLGGFESLEEQRKLLTDRSPVVLIATPKRLNEVVFPHYSTHGQRTDPETGKSKRRIEINDPIEDDVDEDSLTYEVESEDDLNHERLTRPKLSAAAAAQALVKEQEYAKRNNIAILKGGVSAARLQRRKDEDDEEFDGVNTDFLPPTYAQGYEAQKFLRTGFEKSRENLRSPLKRLMSDLKYLILDEADHTLPPFEKYPNTRDKKMRIRHPKPSHVLVKGLQLLNPYMQMIASSATLNNQFMKLIWQLGFHQIPPITIKVDPRDGRAFVKQGYKSQLVELPSDKSQALLPATTNSSSTSPNTSSPVFSNVLDVLRQQDGSIRAVDSSALLSFTECPPNIKHFYTLAPTYRQWRTGTHDITPTDLDQRMEYDYFAPEAERQAVHEHNLQVRGQMRKSAFVLDKICTLKILLSTFKPTFPLLVVDDQEFSIRDIHNMCHLVGIKSTILYEHLSSTDAAIRQQLFDDMAHKKYDLLLVSATSLRGLDFPQCDVVFNLQCLRDTSDYVHAAGRTGRLGREGSVITLLHTEEKIRWNTLVGQLPGSLSSAQQIGLPKSLSSSDRDFFLGAYDAMRDEREAKEKEVNAHLKLHLKRRVRSDADREKREARKLKEKQQELKRELQLSQQLKSGTN